MKGDIPSEFTPGATDNFVATGTIVKGLTLLNASILCGIRPTL